MQDIILIGSGGCMREIAWQIQELNKEKIVWNMVGYVDCEKPENGIGITVGGQVIPYLGDDDYLLGMQESVNVALCVGVPRLRRKIAEKLQVNPYIQFPILKLGGYKLVKT